MNKITGEAFVNMLISASNHLENNKEEINRLNVFPVPDGDTGTNMSLTFYKATSGITTMSDNAVSDIAEKVASAALRGARGNSGVILSQFLRGLSKGFKGMSTIEVSSFKSALEAGTKEAYNAVMKPTEGTILTVMRGLSEKAATVETETIEEFLEIVIKAGYETLEKTPDLLPKLKQAGVVDAGGVGLMVIMDGMFDYIKTGNILEIKEKKDNDDENQIPSSAAEIIEDITFGYCTEFIIEKKHRGVETLRNKLEKIGDSVVVVEDEEIIKVHVHTDTPDTALSLGLKIGQLINIKIDNMRHQNEQLKLEKAKSRSKYGFVSVASGEGFKKIYSDLGIKGIIYGGQSMNPSTDDILKTANEVNAETVFVFPNNKNIILAANQAKELFDGQLIVIETTSMAEVFSLMMLYDENATPEMLTNFFNEALVNIKTGQVTYAVRDSIVNDIPVKEGDIMGMVESRLVKSGEDIDATAFETIKETVTEETEIITVYAGEDIDEERLEAFVEKLEEEFPDCDISSYNGGQPIYYYIFSIE